MSGMIDSTRINIDKFNTLPAIGRSNCTMLCVTPRKNRQRALLELARGTNLGKQSASPSPGSNLGELELTSGIAKPTASLNSYTQSHLTSTLSYAAFRTLSPPSIQQASLSPAE